MLFKALHIILLVCVGGLGGGEGGILAQLIFTCA